MGAIIVLVIWIAGYAWLGWELYHAPEVPKELEDLF
jgi:hypothetical protein